MKDLKIIVLLILIVTSIACSKDDGTDGVSTFSESYAIKLLGGTANNSINEQIIVEREDVINDEKININSVNSNGNTLTIRINIPADLSPSGNKESIGISIQNLDANNIWNIEDTYQTFHFSLNGAQRKRAIVDYIIEGDSEQFGSLNIFTKSAVSLKREGALLIGTLQATLESTRRNIVQINGTFEANLGEDNLE